VDIEEERRRFHRILFDAPVRISNDSNDEAITSLIDISLNGALLIRPDNWQGNPGQLVELTVLLDDAESRILMEAQVTHLDADTMGLRCNNIDMESIGHLRRLVELNLGDAQLLERDLDALR
jgi:hypothetical protein